MTNWHSLGTLASDPSPDDLGCAGDAFDKTGLELVLSFREDAVQRTLKPLGVALQSIGPNDHDLTGAVSSVSRAAA